MTINDIAKFSNVSVSTVSKIINGKDKGIKKETRERVLKIVKEYRYKPYDFIKHNTNSRNFLLGLLLPGIKNFDSFQKGFLSEAEKEGYQVQVCLSGSIDSEIKHITALCKNSADAILWKPIERDAAEAVEIFCKNDIPFAVLNAENSENGIFYDFRKAGYAAAKMLIKLGHIKIHCLYDKTDEYESTIWHGVKQCLFDNHRLYVECDDLQEILSVHNCSALICCKWDTALSVYEYAASHKIRIPYDVSVLCIDDKDRIKDFPPISAIPLSLFDFGVFACKCLIEKTEKKRFVFPMYTQEFICKSSNSIDLPIPLRKKRIIVIGSINMDILLAVKNYPQTGESIPANNISMIPGGKGINQAVGAAKLGAKVSLIGNIGRDFDGDMILNVLRENGVDISAVHIDGENPTGKAYIHVQEDGESGIVLYGGANKFLSPDMIDCEEKLFSDAVFCLLQTEIPMVVVQRTMEIARKNKVATMLKPSAIKQIDETVLQGLDFFIPNRKELCRLCPIEGSISKKAAWFLEKGVKTVIVTLDSEGCYVKTSEYEKFFSASNIFTPIDTTGAADAFIAALAVTLSENKSLPDAVIYALCAAGFSTTRVGVVPSLIDTATLQHYMHNA